jgi:formyltetrahydrofolate synthetase
VTAAVNLQAGFGADIGLEKFMNIKCRASGLKPNAAGGQSVRPIDILRLRPSMG